MRLTIAFQFQSVAAVAPLLENTFRVGLANIGILIGLYFTPGIVQARSLLCLSALAAPNHNVALTLCTLGSCRTPPGRGVG